MHARSSFASGHFVRNPNVSGSPSEEDFRVLAVAPTPSPQGDAGTRDLHALTDQRDATRSLLHGVSSGADATIWRMREETRTDELLLDRVRAVEKMLVEANKIIVIGDMKWEEVEADLRLLAINHALRRQLEGLDGALLLVKSTLGHLSVSFVRPALEEMIWLKYLSTLSAEKATKLLLVLGTYDALRSLLAQRDHIGDEGMRGLWYKTSFLDAANEKLDSVKLSLKDLAKEFGWSGMLPSAQWIATQADELGKYKYLHAASSPAIHFSAGEVMRRGWGEPGGKMVTNKQEFRDHLSAFALDQLWRLFFETVAASLPLLQQAGVYSEPLDDETIVPILEPLLELGNVPLVHAAEWNLTPDGPL